MIKLLQLLLESRVDDFKEKYSTIPDETKDLLIKNDPSGNYKYLDWMGRIVSNEPDIKLDDFLSSIQQFKQHDASLGDIYKYKSFSDLKNALTSRKKSNKEITKEGGKILIDDEDFLVVAPQTYDSCGYYGNKTRWCIVGQESWWDKYYYENTIIIVLDRRHNQKYAVVGDFESGNEPDVYDKQDNRLDYVSFVGNGDEDDSEYVWPEYIHDAITNYGERDNVSDRKYSRYETVVDDYLKESGSSEIIYNFLKLLHKEENISSDVDVDGFYNIVNINKISTEEFDSDYVRQFLMYNLQSNGKDYIDRPSNVYEFKDSLQDEEKQEKLDDIISDYIQYIKYKKGYSDIIVSSIGENNYDIINKEGNVDSAILDAVKKYNEMLNSPQQLTLKGIETGQQQVKIKNISDIIYILKKTGYYDIAGKLESFLIKENKKTKHNIIKFKSLLTQ